MKEYYETYLSNESSQTTASSAGESNAMEMINISRNRRGEEIEGDEEEIKEELD